MLEVKGLWKAYSEAAGYVLKNINMKVEKGTIHALIGHNGSGKTTIIKCLTGIFPADEGEVLLDGATVYNNVETKQKIGYVADSNQMFRSYSMKKMAKFYQNIYPSFSMEDFEELSKMFLVDGRKKVSQMSKGQQMRASFVLNMARHPEVMVLDEPTAGLDAMAKKQLLGCLVKAVEEENMTILISSHHLSELERICDTVTLLNSGMVQIQDGLEEVKGQVVKYQAVFPGGAPEELNERKDICDITHIGSVYRLVTQGHIEDFEEQMKACGAVFVEEMPVGLEESFVYLNQTSEGGFYGE